MRRELESPAVARLVVAAMWQATRVTDENACVAIEQTFGKLSCRTTVFDFGKYTPYYEPEMGAVLMKCFIELDESVEREKLVEAKLKAFDLENRFMKEGRRELNVDPMLVTAENVVIATSKNFTHRVYLHSGVFADLALLYRHHTYERLPWTYPDYVDQIPFFNGVRERALAELRAR